MAVKISSRVSGIPRDSHSAPNSADKKTRRAITAHLFNTADIVFEERGEMGKAAIVILPLSIEPE